MDSGLEVRMGTEFSCALWLVLSPPPAGARLVEPATGSSGCGQNSGRAAGAWRRTAGVRSIDFATLPTDQSGPIEIVVGKLLGRPAQALRIAKDFSCQHPAQSLISPHQLQNEGNPTLDGGEHDE